MFGRILKVNLSTGAIERGTIPAEYARDYIGGSGLAARLLWDASILPRIRWTQPARWYG